MANRIQYRRDTAANWTAANPVLALGEPGYETDTKKRKIGDGATAWVSLAYQIDKATADVTYGIANPTLTVTYNSDGTVASTVENSVTTTFTYNSDGTVNTQTRAGTTKTFTYDANGNVTGAA